MGIDFFNDFQKNYFSLYPVSQPAKNVSIKGPRTKLVGHSICPQIAKSTILYKYTLVKRGIWSSSLEESVFRIWNSAVTELKPAKVSVCKVLGIKNKYRKIIIKDIYVVLV